MTIVRGGPAGPDGSGGAYPNEVETDRAAWWHALGGRQGVIRGMRHTGVAGQMALDFTAGAAMLGERAPDGTASLDRGYLVWSDAVTRVTFGPASASDRNDAVVAAFVDVEDGPVGTGGLEVGPHLVVVPGVSGTTTPRTDADINSWLGRGGWVRLMDVPIAAGSTEINVANIVDRRAHGGKHCVRLTRTSDLNYGAAESVVPVPWQQAAEDSTATFTPGATTVTLPRAGLYLITWSLKFGAVAAGSNVGSWARHNGVTVATQNHRQHSLANAYSTHSGSAIIRASAGDTVDVLIRLSSTATIVAASDGFGASGARLSVAEL